MGKTPKDFILFEGPAADGAAKMNLLNFIKYNLKQLEKEKVEYSPENFTIGHHTFRYGDLLVLDLADLRVEYKNGILDTKYIRVVGKDEKEYVLIPAMVGGDTVRALSARSEDLMKFLNEGWGKIKAGKPFNAGTIDKIRKMLAVSTRLKLDMLQQALGLDTATFNNKIFDWAADFNFKIDGDSIVIEGGDVPGFISKLDSEFSD